MHATSIHFAPGTFVTLDNRTYAVVSRIGDALLLTDGHGESGWVRPFALAGRRDATTTTASNVAPGAPADPTPSTTNATP